MLGLMVVISIEYYVSPIFLQLNHPAGICCPITHELMIDPVVIVDGQTVGCDSKIV
jgi:hypothetical protein